MNPVMKNARSLVLSLAKAQGTEIFLLQGQAPDSGVKADPKTGVISNVAILTAGMAYPAIGEPFEIDEVMLQQVADLINAAPGGVKSRISHPELKPGFLGGLEDGIFYLVGRAKNARVENRAVRGDMHLAEYADSSPTGKHRTYLLGVADEDPSAIGISIRFIQAEPICREGMPDLVRVYAVTAVDFVGTPGGNPNGLLSGREPAPNPKTPKAGEGSPSASQGDLAMNARQMAYLRSCGLKDGASAEEIKTFLSGLKAEQTQYLNGLVEKPAPDPKGPEKKPETGLAGDEAKAQAEKAAQDALAGDRDRRKAILALSAGENAAITADVARQWADDGVTVADAKRLTELAGKLKPVPSGRTVGGEDRNLATLADGISDALLLRAGHGTGAPNSMPLMTFDPVTGLAARDASGAIVARKPGERALSMRRMPVAEMARQYLAAVGVPAMSLSNMGADGCIALASGRRSEFPKALQQAGGNISLAMSTSDFPYILADAMNKVFLGGYNLAPSTWSQWCRRTTARDFKDVKLLNLGGAPALSARAEGKGIAFGSMSESREIIALVEYSAGLVFTRRMQINDDLGVFRDGGAMSLGAMARYKEDDVVYAILTANAAMSDTGLLFNVTAVTTAGGHANQSAGASTAVYATAAPGICPTVVAMFLDSEQSPVMKQEIAWDTDDLKVAVRHSVAAKAADWRGMYKDVSGAVTIAELAVIVQAMALQKDPNGAFLNLRPSFILCPAGASEVNWAQLIGSSVDPSKNNATPNPFANKLTVIGEPRLN